MPIPVSDLNTLSVTCDNAANEAASIADLKDMSGTSIALERIHRDLIDALTIVARLERSATQPETGDIQ